MVALAGSRPIGTALLAVRDSRGWVSGVGVVPGWRRRGVARALMERVLTAASAAGVKRVALEVITENRPALELYRTLGFRATRELLTWRRPADADPLPAPRERLQQTSPAVLLADFAAWHDQAACWQRELASLRRLTGMMTGYRIVRNGSPAAYCLVSDTDEGVMLADIGLNPNADWLTAGRSLLQALAATHLDRPLYTPNVPADSSLCRILAALRFLVTLRRVEMIVEM